ncbi:MAG: FAD-dependent oxidoreductase, partial [Spirochaetales bacterium]|nr:FAD-dependent oxidoreductase [Spirochaetales bacterium]
ISATKLGFASTRIIGCCAVGGQAVGAAASLCRKYGITRPRDLAPHVPEVQQILLKHDAFLPGFVNRDPEDLALKATFTATSHVRGGEPQKVADGVSRRIGSESHAWVTDRVSGEELSMKLPKAAKIRQMRFTFDSNFAYPIRVTMSPNRQAQQRIGVPEELVKDYDVIFRLNGKDLRTVQVRDNHQRLNVVDVEPVDCDEVILKVLSTNGAGVITVFEVRAY